MKLLNTNRRHAAFSKKDVLAVILVIGAGAALFFPWLNRARNRAGSICCNCNLKQIGLAFRIWEADHTNLYPMSVSSNFGGSQEAIATGEVFRHFQVMSNELNTPIILVCPNDLRRSAKDFGAGFSNSNVSYFIGLVTNDSNPQAFLSGDRNLTVDGVALKPGLHAVGTNQVVGWTKEMHVNQGNVLMADGSVQGFNQSGLQQALTATGVATNRLAVP